MQWQINQLRLIYGPVGCPEIKEWIVNFSGGTQVLILIEIKFW